MLLFHPSSFFFLLSPGAPPNPSRQVLGDTIIFRSVQMGSSAVYQCNASNHHGYLLANAFVSVLGEIQSVSWCHGAPTLAQVYISVCLNISKKLGQGPVYHCFGSLLLQTTLCKREELRRSVIWVWKAMFLILLLDFSWYRISAFWGFCCHSFHFIIHQKFSMGDSSGLQTGQFKTYVALLSYTVLTECDTVLLK